jgi:GTP-binding protein EngB required for normal cell division
VSPRLRGRHRRADLPGMLNALDEAIDALDGRADPKAVRRALAVGARAGERLRLSGEHTVVALAGSTGSGKSSMFNALAGEQLSPEGVRRPTTSRAYACVWGSEGATPLVQWLGVPRRQTSWRHGTGDAWGRAIGGRSAPEDELDGLVLLDLPDHDSTVVEHRMEVDRLVELVDLLVWVVDPQKYADQVLHERYLRRLAGHSAVTIVVLNQVDTVNPFAAAECAEDLRRLLDKDGLRRSPVLTTSVRTGAGLLELRMLLADAVSRRRARNDRLVADVEDVVEGLVSSVAAEERGRVGRARPAGRGARVVGRSAGHRPRGRGVVAPAGRGRAGLAADPVGAPAAAGPAAPAAPEAWGAQAGPGGDGPVLGAGADPGAARAGGPRAA